MDQINSYKEFLKGKLKLADAEGFEVDPSEINPALKDFVREIVRWAARGGRRAIFSAFGLHKTSAQLELARLTLARHKGAHALIVLPLGVRHEFFDEVRQRFTGAHGLRLKFIQRTCEIEEQQLDIEGDRLPPLVHVANYEPVRDGKIDLSKFIFASLDEAAVLRGYGTKTFQTFLPMFAKVRYRYVATATPSPNRTKELIHYAGFLGIMDTGQALTRFFQRDSTKANELTLYPHKEEEFWLWVHSWAIFLRKPSDLGFSDDGYIFPELDVRWHEIPSDHSTAKPDRDGQGFLFRNTALGVTQAAAEKRDSLPGRIAKMQELRAEDPSAHRVIWHDLEAERAAIEQAIPAVRAIFGSQDIKVNERHAIDFKYGRFQELATKPEMSGAGCNFQGFCHWAIFLGIGFKFHDFIQAVHRLARFGQSERVRIDIIYSDAEREVRANLESKWREHDTLMTRMGEIIRSYGLNALPHQEMLRRSMGVDRIEETGERFAIANNDAVDEAQRRDDDSIDLLVTSIPFANHYEYTEKYEDFGHTDDNDHFWAQMDFLTPELIRIIKPGRLACIHVKDRVNFGNVTGAGLPTISPFHAEAIFHYRRHGFDYCGMVTVVTDVVRENNQTYRLGYSEMVKDASKVHVGSPEYVLLFHKPQSDRGRSYADQRVTKRKPDCKTEAGDTVPYNEKLHIVPGTGYSLARWQINAHAFWRSSGNRLITVDELMGYGPDALAKIFPQWSLQEPYDFERHVAIGEALEERHALPSTFMALAPGSWHPQVWHDINRMRTLNGEQARRNLEFHICPLQFDIVDRLIAQYSNPDEWVYDPFGGLMTVPYRAITLGWRGAASELNLTSFRDGLHYCRQAEKQAGVVDLFAVEAATAS